MLNICSLKNKVLLLENFINEKLKEKCTPDFILITEHWLKELDVQNYQLKNYRICSHNCRDNFKNGGTMILANQSYNKNIKIKQKFQKFNCEKVYECSALEIRVKSDKVILLCMYRAPSGDFKLFLEKLEASFALISKMKKKFIIGGDFNIDLLLNTDKSRALKHLIKQFDGYPVIKNESTR